MRVMAALLLSFALGGAAHAEVTETTRAANADTLSS